MPLTLHIGFSRKVGEANYGSRGASVDLSQELDSSLATDPPKLQAQIHQLFMQAKAAVAEELRVTPSTSADHGTACRDTPERGANRVTSPPQNHPPAATAAQVRALHAIARRQLFDLVDLLRERFDHDHPEALSLDEASSLISELGQLATQGSSPVHAG